LPLNSLILSSFEFILLLISFMAFFISLSVFFSSVYLFIDWLIHSFIDTFIFDDAGVWTQALHVWGMHTTSTVTPSALFFDFLKSHLCLCYISVLNFLINSLCFLKACLIKQLFKLYTWELSFWSSLVLYFDPSLKQGFPENS
jgi:hypothetical protein